MSNETSGIETTEGFISFPKHPRLNCILPVALDFSVKSDNDIYPPAKENGEILYVLPGGERTTLSALGV